MGAIVGNGNHGDMVAITGRSAGMLSMGKLNKGTNAKELALAAMSTPLPSRDFAKTITAGNGTEFACHEDVTKAFGATVFFADPYSSWQRGAVWNQDGLARQYIPEATVSGSVSHQFVASAMGKTNRRHGEGLGFSTPKELSCGKIPQIRACWLNLPTGYYRPAG